MFPKLGYSLESSQEDFNILVLVSPHPRTPRDSNLIGLEWGLGIGNFRRPSDDSNASEVEKHYFRRPKKESLLTLHLLLLEFFQSTFVFYQQKQTLTGWRLTCQSHRFQWATGKSSSHRFSTLTAHEITLSSFLKCHTKAS